MNIIKSKILALSIFCVIGGATQAMQPDESLLRITNKTNIKGRANIACEGFDRDGDFRRGIEAYEIEPGTTFNFKVKDLPSELAPSKCTISTFYGIFSFIDDQSVTRRVTWDHVRSSRHLAFVRDDETNGYKIIEVNETN